MQISLRFIAIAAAVSILIGLWVVFGEAIRRPEFADYQGFGGLVHNAALGAACGFPIVLVFGAVIGLPIDFLICRLGIANIWSFSAAGVFAGASIMAMLGGLSTWEEAALFATSGSVAGLLWWVLVRRKYSSELFNG
jgi:hypothetical protein